MIFCKNVNFYKIPNRVEEGSERRGLKLLNNDKNASQVGSSSCDAKRKVAKPSSDVLQYPILHIHPFAEHRRLANG